MEYATCYYCAELVHSIAEGGAMALVSKVRAEVTITVQDRADTVRMKLDVETAAALDSLDAVGPAVADALGKQIAALMKAQRTAPAPEAKPEPPAPPIGPVTMTYEAPAEPAPSRRRRGQS
jgi:hypothetical protein